MKILSPAGNFECLKMAVYNGADEVYLGINNFNARNNIDGFSLDTLKQAIDFAHIYNVKVNLAINILFSDDELQDALNTIVSSYNLGVDSFIIQDLGLAHLIHLNYPEIEIHASTQMGLHNLEGVKAIEKFGFKRVVLARETPLEEIKRIKANTNVEIEYFAQGALCVSFSGNCYLSSYLLNASGNRGKCKQLCRLPYTLEYNNKKIKSGYLLSAKDFNMTTRLTDLKDAGVDVLKIEGRARRPYYVAVATREYYNALNNLETNQDNLKLAFNREFTCGYFDDNGEIISSYNNHMGICIGKIEKINTGKKFNEVYFSSSRELSQKSTFKTYKNKEEQNTLTAFDLTKISNGKYKLTTTQNLSVNDNIHLIIDAADEESVLAFKKKKQINLKIFAMRGKPIKAFFNYENQEYEVWGPVLEPAQKQPLTKEELVKNFKKHDLFDAELEIMHLEDVFIPTKILNEFRRNVFENIFDTITKKYRHNESVKNIKVNQPIKKLENFQIIQNLNEKLTENIIIFSPEIYNLDEIKKFKNLCEEKNKTPLLDTPNFALKNDIEFLKQTISETNLPIVANNYYALLLSENYVVGAGLNVYNSVSANVYNKPVITAESELSTKINFPVMTLRHCPFKSHLNASCANCPYKQGYTYRMDNGKVLKLNRKKLSTCTFYLSI